MSECVILETETILEVVELAIPGSPGPPGDAWLPDPATLADGRYITTAGGQYVDIPAPAGTGDMQTLIYDPAGKAADCFNAGNLSGYIDCGEF
jgi:hypothetical protein